MNKYDDIEKIIKEVLTQIINEPMSSEWSTHEWTHQIKKILCKVGTEKGFDTCASINDADWPEWLYDLAWLNYSEDHFLTSVPLVLECEWDKTDKEIDDDFQKLLLSRAQHRVMIFNKKTVKDVKTKMDNFQVQILNFKDTQPTDRYFFAGYSLDNESFEFRLFIPN